jgi:hypothetical protein
MRKAEFKSLNSFDEPRGVDKRRVKLIKTGGAVIGRAVFDPDRKWSEPMNPIAKTKSCEKPHCQCYVSGTIRVKMDDGTEMELKPEDVSLLPSGRDAWVVGIGNAPVVAIDFQSMVDHTRQLKKNN